MSGMHDGVSKVWIMRADFGLNITGCKSDIEAIDALIRHALTFGPPETKAAIEAAVAEALTHLDPKPEADTEDAA